MTRFGKLGTAATIALTLTLAWSSRPAQGEIDAAQAEIDRARQAEAEVWAPDELRAAAEALAAALASIAAEEGKWIKSYERATQLLARARDEAASAVEGSIANKAQMRSDAESSIRAAETALDGARKHIDNVPSSRFSRGDRALFRKDLSGIPASLDEARQSLVEGDFSASLTTATEAESRIASVMDRIESALDRRPLPPK